MEIILGTEERSWARVRTADCCDGDCVAFHWYVADTGAATKEETITRKYAVDFALAILEVAGGISDETFERYRLDLAEKIRGSHG